MEKLKIPKDVTHCDDSRTLPKEERKKLNWRMLSKP